jgi:pyridoxine kinase
MARHVNATIAAVTSILSIQSSVAYGHVGNSAATFPLMRMGVEVWPVLTVHFSNHTGYEAWRGPMLSAGDVADVVRGIDERGVLGRCDAVLSGYQGGEDVGLVILDAVALVKERNPRAIYCCDPVMGDVGRGFYVRPGIPELMRDRVVPAAQIITPNQFELEFLTGRETSNVDDVILAAQSALDLGPETVLVTSVVSEGSDFLGMIAVTRAGAWSVTTPLLPRTFTGAGDLTAAVFLAQLLQSGNVPAAVRHTAAVVYAVLKATIDAGETELQLVAAQEEIAHPSTFFPVTRVG